MLAVALKTGIKVARIMEKENARKHKAMATSVKVEAFRVRKEGAMDLKTGKLGLKPLSVLQKRSGKKARKRKPKAPLRELFKGIIYKVDKHNLKAEVGFIGMEPGVQWINRLAEKHAEGYTIIYTPEVIEKAHERGVHIRKDTHSVLVPARGIMGAILAKHGDESPSNIARNFERKMRGERI